MNMPVVTERKHTRTRKYHHCCECGAYLPPGTVMMVHRGLWEEGPATQHWCLSCDLLFKAAQELLVPGETLHYGELHDFIRNVA